MTSALGNLGALKLVCLVAEINDIEGLGISFSWKANVNLSLGSVINLEIRFSVYNTRKAKIVQITFPSNHTSAVNIYELITEMSTVRTANTN